jgi:hypothetical protein
LLLPTHKAYMYLERERDNCMFIINTITYMRITRQIYFVELREGGVSKVAKGQFPETLLELE